MSAHAWYGCHPDGEDGRDRNFMLSWFQRRPAAAWFVPSGPIDLFPWFPPVMYQGPEGTCTVHGVTTALRFNLIDNNLPDVPLSRAQLYYDAGLLEGNTADVGRQIRDVVKVAATQGVAPEAMWGYDKWDQAPTDEVHAAAKAIEAIEYQRVDISLEALRTALYVGRPVIIGIDVYPQFESDEAAATGIIRTPQRFVETPIARHCMAIGSNGVMPGYSGVRNSWGLDWGKGGNCFIADDYLGSPSFGADYWAIFQNKEIPS
jgi:hypothetical protein